jgi:hypothetical protein
VCELNADCGFFTFYEGDEGFKTLRLCIIPDAKVMLIDQANLLDSSCLDEDKPKASEGKAAEMDVVKGAARVARSGAVVDHRRHDKAILEDQATDLNGLEQQRS